MDKVVYLQVEKETFMKAEEPALSVYEANSLRALQNKTADMVYKTTDKRILMACMEDLSMHDMPCVFTDEEYRDEIALSEKSANVSHEDVKKELALWGFAE